MNKVSNSSNRYIELIIIILAALLFTTLAVFLDFYSVSLYVQMPILFILWTLYGALCWYSGQQKLKRQKGIPPATHKLRLSNIYKMGFTAFVPLSIAAYTGSTTLSLIELGSSFFFFVFAYGGAWFIVGNENKDGLGELIYELKQRSGF